jgi:hypothetical protein
MFLACASWKAALVEMVEGAHGGIEAFVVCAKDCLVVAVEENPRHRNEDSASETKIFLSQRREWYFGCEPTEDEDRKNLLGCVCLFCERCVKCFAAYFPRKSAIPLHWQRTLCVPACPCCSDTAMQTPLEQVRTSRWPPNLWLREYLDNTNPASSPTSIQRHMRSKPRPHPVNFHRHIRPRR